MLVKYEVKDPNEYHLEVLIDEPTICPLCHHAVKPVETSFYQFTGDNKEYFVSISYLCRNCFSPFISKHSLIFIPEGFDDYSCESQLIFCGPKDFIKKTFSEEIERISPMFVKIYNEAFFAENNNLLEICGVGYRKAFEFLVKDYLMHKTPSEAKDIKNNPLHQCINNRISNEVIKQVALRCAWLGNDHTHYEKKFQNKDIFDLKEILDAFVSWIEMELRTEKILSIQSAK